MADHQQAQDDGTLRADALLALARGELALVYQPCVNLQLGTVHSLETLLRWRHPGHGDVPPDRFIPMLEATDALQPVTEWLIRQALAELAPVLARWPQLRIGFNIAPSAAVPDAMRRLLVAIGGFDRRRVSFEITERVFIGNVDAARAAFRLARQVGVRLALDDFGTGYASLGYLQRFPIVTLKIDKSFIATVDEPGGDRAALAGLRTAEIFGLRVFAEGVERPGQLAWLDRHGCRHAQGYLFSRPLPAAAVAPFIEGFRCPSPPDEGRSARGGLLRPRRPAVADAARPCATCGRDAVAPPNDLLPATVPPVEPLTGGW